MSDTPDIENARLTRVIESLPDGIPQTANALLRTGGDAADLAAACLFSEDRTVARLVVQKLEDSPHDVALNAAATLVRMALTIKSPEMKDAIYGDGYLHDISKSGAPLSEIHPFLMNRTADGRDDLTTLVSASALAQRLPESGRQVWNAIVADMQPVMYPVAQNFLHNPFEMARMNNEVRGGVDPTIPTETFLTSLETPASSWNRPPDTYAIPPTIPLMGSLVAHTSAQYVYAMPECVTGNESMMAITRGMRADGLDIQAENPLCVVPHILDGSLHMPPTERFFSTGDYNAALLHEMAHAAGEENRDDRAQRVHYGLTGSISGQEEIVADLTVLSLSQRYANTHVNQHQLLCHAREQAEGLRQSAPSLVDARAISALNDLAERGAQYIHDAVTRHIASAVKPTATLPESPGLRIRNGLLETHKAITRLEGHITVSKMAPAIAREPSDLDHRQQRLFDALHDRIGVTSEHIERAKNLIGEMPSLDAQVRELRALHDRLTTVHNNLGTVPDYLAPKLLQGVVAQQLSGVDSHLIASTRARMENEKISLPTQSMNHLHTLKKGPNT
ncbi:MULTISPECIES: zincin-like metallopeptidase domain-containing protein [Acidithiobacillus]|uniref:zincin-like metallopeptidase domain-containing protein n=1 Tax=Acidithiobacillus ferrivorans TaxID=160808 RepID=UPI001C070DDB|nr:zincin-like metallopeptidase domain-containing protein [Acidithiobacillus ferrivorans]MBU2851663.1 hypothetical protein [Acidithiobacillus ferrivorans]